MQLLNGRLVLSPSDLNDHVECAHLTALSLEVARGARPRPGVPLLAQPAQRGHLPRHGPGLRGGESPSPRIEGARSIEQMRLINALCRFVEMAEEQGGSRR
jgi:hypothetical protein